MLNPALDPAALAPGFRQRGRIRIADALVPEAAEALHACLAADIPWRLSCYDNRRPPAERPVKLSREQLGAMTPAQRQGLQAEVLRQAGDQFQYVYQSFDLLEGHRQGERPGLFVYRLMEYLAGDDFFAFVRTLTGDAEIDRIDGHATRYAAGHFLKDHADESPFERRRFAYVLSVTRGWSADMGGLLHFTDADGRVVDSLVPGFNTLALFAVPTPHHVSYVPPWVEGERLSVTGWLTVPER
jgi:Rps23 Pro-64 3,4-dihydroxylase Tpa1-like proline 4-hydroxylase